MPYYIFLKGMIDLTILYDTREKLDNIQPILTYFYNLNIEVERIKLDVGDYINKDHINNDSYITIDRKGGGLWEMAVDLGFDFLRFKNEIIRCRKQRILLVVLIADEQRTCLEDILTWTPPYDTREKKKAMTAEKLYKIMKTQSECYSDCLRYEFVKPENMAERIVELLK